VANLRILDGALRRLRGRGGETRPAQVQHESIILQPVEEKAEIGLREEPRSEQARKRNRDVTKGDSALDGRARGRWVVRQAQRHEIDPADHGDVHIIPEARIALDKRHVATRAEPAIETEDPGIFEVLRNAPGATLEFVVAGETNGMVATGIDYRGAGLAILAKETDADVASSYKILNQDWLVIDPIQGALGCALGEVDESDAALLVDGLGDAANGRLGIGQDPREFVPVGNKRAGRGRNRERVTKVVEAPLVI